MKKWMVLLLALALPCFAAQAQEVPTALPAGQFVRIGEDENIRIDGEDLHSAGVFFSYAVDDEGGGATFRLNVGSLEVEGVADDPTGEVYALRLLGVPGVLLFVPDNGMSSDYASFVFHYIADDQGAAERLYQLGYVGGFPQYMQGTGFNTFTTYERGRTLMTWFRPADYVVAAGYYYGDDGVTTTYGLAEVPRDIYPVGAQIALKAELPLMASRADDTVVRTLLPGEIAVVAGSDDAEWLYISAPADDYEEAGGGWVRMVRGAYGELWIDGQRVEASEVMDGLLYAD